MDAPAATATGSLDELRALLRDFDTAMLVTVGAGGALRSRPMALQHGALGDCDLWFVTADDTPKTDEIARDHHVNVCCVRNRDCAYLSISARARVDQNAAEVQRLWQLDWKIWLPDEPADGSIALLKLTVERAEYWPPDGGRMKLIYETAARLDDAADQPLTFFKRIG